MILPKALSRSIRTIVLGLVVITSQWCAGADPKDLSGQVLVMGAASTRDALELVRAEFIKRNPGVMIRANYGASSALAQQIQAGAQADIFLSASTEWARFLADKQLIDKQQDLLGNKLLIVKPQDSTLVIKTPADLTQEKIRHLALADPKSVPAGIYAKQALTKLDLWSKLESRVTGAADVRQALHFVETGAAEAGIVYSTDALESGKVRTALQLDPQLSEPIRYPLVLLKHGANNSAAVEFYGFLASPAAADIFAKLGFVVLTPPAKPSP